MSALIMLGNVRPNAFINAIAAVADMSKQYEDPLERIFVVHSEESLLAFHKFEMEDLFRKYELGLESFVHAVIPMDLPSVSQETSRKEGSNRDEDRRAQALKNLASFISQSIATHESDRLYVDLTNSTVVYKAALSNAAYILGLENQYMIDTARAWAQYKQQFEADEAPLEATVLRDIYVRLPAPHHFDSLGYWKSTEITRYADQARKFAQRLLERDSSSDYEVASLDQDPPAGEVGLLQRFLTLSAETRLRSALADRDDRLITAAAEAGIAFDIFIRWVSKAYLSGSVNERLYDRLLKLREKAHETIGQSDAKVLETLNTLMRELRNAAAHGNQEMDAHKATLMVRLLPLLLDYHADAILPRLSASAGPSAAVRTEVQIPAQERERFFVGVDGDNTGQILQRLFVQGASTARFRSYSGAVSKAIAAVWKSACRRCKPTEKIFMAGDDLLFAGHCDRADLEELQKTYFSAAKEATGNLPDEGDLTCSIAYGKSLHDVFIALKVAKGTPGKNAIVGLDLGASGAS